MRNKLCECPLFWCYSHIPHPDQLITLTEDHSPHLETRSLTHLWRHKAHILDLQGQASDSICSLIFSGTTRNSTSMFLSGSVKILLPQILNSNPLTIPAPSDKRKLRMYWKVKTKIFFLSVLTFR